MITPNMLVNEVKTMELEMTYALLRFSILCNVVLFVSLHIFLFHQFYKLFQFQHAWLSFIPIFPFFALPLFWKIDRSWYHSLLWFIPIANIYFIIRDMVDFFRKMEFSVPVSMFVSIFVPMGFYFLLMFHITMKKDGFSPATPQPTATTYYEEPPVFFQPERKVKQEKKQEKKMFGRKKEHVPEEPPDVPVPPRPPSKEQVLATHFFEEDGHVQFISKWLKSNLEIYMKSGFRIDNTYLYAIKRELFTAGIKEEDIRMYVQRKQFYYDDCLSLVEKGALDEITVTILDYYLAIFHKLCILIYGSNEPNKEVIEIVEIIISLIKIEDTKDGAYLYDVLFDQDVIESLANVVGIESWKLENILQTFYEQH